MPTSLTGAVMLGRVTLADATLDTNVPGVQLVPAAPSLDGDMVELSKLLGPEQRLNQMRHKRPKPDCAGNPDERC